MSSSNSTANMMYETVYCHCKLQCPVRTVRKECKNKGRKFYGCPRWEEGFDCRFFKWVDSSTCVAESSGRLESKIEQAYVDNLKEVGQLLRTVLERIEDGRRLQHLMFGAQAVLILVMICFMIILASRC